MHPLPAAAEDELGVRVVITGNHRNSAAGSGLHDADCSMEKILGWPHRYGIVRLGAICDARCTLAKRTICQRCTPKLSLWDADPLSRKKRRFHLAGRTWCQGFSPHLSRNAATHDPASPMRSRENDRCRPIGHDVRVMWHDESVICLEIFDRT